MDAWVLDTRMAKKKGPGGPGPEVLQKDMSESSPSWTVWPMPSPALRALALHSVSQGINVSKCDVPSQTPGMRFRLGDVQGLVGRRELLRRPCLQGFPGRLELCLGRVAILAVTCSQCNISFVSVEVAQLGLVPTERKMLKIKGGYSGGKEPLHGVQSTSPF